jgi:hypothetical protein
MVTSANSNYVLDEVVTALVFEALYDSTEFLLPELYDVRGSNSRRERLASTGALSRYTEKLPGVSADEDSISQQWEKDFTHKVFAKQIPIEQELIDDEEWGYVADISRQMGQLAGYSMEEDAAAPFNEAFSSSTYKSEDGLSICNGAHLNAAGGNSQSNSGTTALSITSVGATRTLMRKFTNSRALKMIVRPDELHVPVDLEETAWEIVNSMGRTGTANNNANMYNGMFRLVVNDFFTDVNNWFMADSKMRKANLLWFMRKAFQSFGDGNLFSGVRRVGAQYRESHGCRDWRWIYGHAVS